MHIPPTIFEQTSTYPPSPYMYTHTHTHLTAPTHLARDRFVRTQSNGVWQRSGNSHQLHLCSFIPHFLFLSVWLLKNTQGSKQISEGDFKFTVLSISSESRVCNFAVPFLSFSRMPNGSYVVILGNCFFPVWFIRN